MFFFSMYMILVTHEQVPNMGRSNCSSTHGTVCRRASKVVVHHVVKFFSRRNTALEEAPAPVGALLNRQTRNSFG